MVRHNNQLPNNLPQLQHLIKKDPETYKEEFISQYRQYESYIQVFRLNPDKYNKDLDDSVMFLAQVAHCYPDKLQTFAQQLIDVLHSHCTVLHAEMRMALCRSLVLLRNKRLLAPTDLIPPFFQLLRSKDKKLRTFLQTHIVSDIKNVNAKHKDVRVNSSLQNLIFIELKSSNSKISKMAVNILIELYKKNVWTDAKTVNAISTACFSKFTKVMVTALKFFLGTDPEEEASDSSDSETESNARDVMKANKFNKKTKKREKQLSKAKKLLSKSQKKKSRAPQFNFSALHLIHDPQSFAEKLFSQLQKSNERFEVKLMHLDIVSRLIGLHNLFLFNYYPFVQRFISPHHREVTRMLQFLAQASHDLIPPDVIEPVLKTIANNFITERNSSDVMAIGLNAVREICARCPLAMNEDLLRDLAEYKNYKDRSVMMAARSLIGLFRTTRSDLLHKRDRGRPTEASHETRTLRYGELDAKDYVPGAEVLQEKSSDVDSDEESDQDSDSEDSEEWVDVDHSSDEEADESVDEESERKMDVEDKSECASQNSSVVSKVNDNKKSKFTDLEDKVQAAQQMSSMKLLSDKEHRMIEEANIRKRMQVAKKGTKRKIDEVSMKEPSELVKLSEIVDIYKKRKHDKKTRMESVRKGQADREKFGYKDGRQNIHCSTTNREKRKTKNFQMIRHKARTKVKRSFKDKQIALRNHLIKQKRMK